MPNLVYEKSKALVKPMSPYESSQRLIFGDLKFDAPCLAFVRNHFKLISFQIAFANTNDKTSGPAIATQF